MSWEGKGWGVYPSVSAGAKKALVRQKSQAILSRKMAMVQDRAITDAQRKTKQAERMLGNAPSVSSMTKKTVKEVERVTRESTKV